MLGTESKAGDETVPEEDRDGLPPRLRQGQKGIGRLSVAYLGPTVLVLTKRASGPYVAALIDWRLFQNPYLALDDVRIPVESFQNQEEIQQVLSTLFDGLIDNVWGSSDDKERQARLNDVWNRFTQDEARRGEPSSAEQIANLAVSGSLEKRHLEAWPGWTGDRPHGTAMFVFDVVRELRVWVERGIASEDPEVSQVRDKLRFTLTGFTNPYAESHMDFGYKAMVHLGTSERTIVSSDEVFDMHDLRDLEHLVEGRFDEMGVFTGRVKAWGKDLGELVVPPFRPPPLRGAAYVGPFDIAFGTFELDARNSTHTPDVIGRLKTLADQFSGLAVYRDGLRVQPYGRPENDFFGMEERRSMHAGRHFWSHRRTFGAVAITREDNSHLRDKAGREGFIDNQAAREFRLLVEGLLGTLARRYFGSDSELRERETVLTRARYERAKKAEEQARKRRVTSLKSALREQSPILETAIATAEALMNDLASGRDCGDLEEVGVEIARLQDVRSSLSLPPRPRKLTARMEELYRAYRDDYANLTAILERSHELWADKADQHVSIAADDMARTALSRNQKLLTDATGRWKAAIIGTLKQEEVRWSSRVQSDNQQYYTQAAPLLADLAAERQELGSVLGELDAIRERLFTEFAPDYEGYLRALRTLRDGIDLDAALTWATDERTVLSDRVEQWQELAQLGITVEIVGHELNETATQVSRNLARLPRDAKDTAAYKLAYEGFRSLVQRLEFLAPLRLSGPRTRRLISGRELEVYIRSFFQRPLQERNIKLDVTDAFRAAQVLEYPHRVFPVFVNLVNNALYWVTLGQERRVLLDRVDDDILVADTGPGVDPDDQENLFNLFFTRRVGGHGVGLYLSRLALEQGRHSVRLATAPNERVLEGANFLIHFRELQDE